MQFYDGTILIDTSAAVALVNPKDQFHKQALSFFNFSPDIVWVVLNCTRHESYTRSRYDYDFNSAIKIYDYLSSEPLYQLFFDKSDEDEARNLLQQYNEHKISFHDALCASVMIKNGIYKVFTFDRHFYIFGFEVYPGPYR